MGGPVFKEQKPRNARSSASGTRARWGPEGSVCRRAATKPERSSQEHRSFDSIRAIPRAQGEYRAWGDTHCREAWRKRGIRANAGRPRRKVSRKYRL